MLETLDYTIRIGSTPIHQYTVFRFVSLLCLRSTLRLFLSAILYFEKCCATLGISPIGANNSLKSRLDMKDNRKCITTSFTISIWNHFFLSVEANLGSVFSFVRFLDFVFEFFLLNNYIIKNVFLKLPRWTFINVYSQTRQ